MSAAPVFATALDDNQQPELTVILHSLSAPCSGICRLVFEP